GRHGLCNDRMERAEYVCGTAAVCQPVEGQPNPIRRGYVVAVANVTGLEADGRRRALAEGRVAQFGDRIHCADDFRADAVRARSVERIAGMRWPADHEGEGRKLAD